MERRLVLKLSTVVLAVAVFLAVASPAWADEFVVTENGDPTPDDCTATECSLREAVIAANATAEQDTITIPEGTYTLTIPASGGLDPNDSTTGDLDLNEAVIITGAGARSTIVTGGEGFDDRIFDVPPGVEAVGDVAEVPSDVEADISGLTITGGNVADFGGGLRNVGAFLLLEESTVSGNTSTIDGGGIRNDSTLRISRVTVSDNESDSFGGGILNDGETNAPIVVGAGLEGPGNLEIVNSTVSGNASLEGGGIINANDGQLSLTNVTLNNNSAAQGSNFSGGFATATFKNTIVANAQGGGENCATDPKMPIDSLGNNLDDDGSCALDEGSDINNENPLLGPLQDNGGPTDTHALNAGSPALDAADNDACPPTDQRGVERPQGATCDIGAFEAEAADLSITKNAPATVTDEREFTYRLTVTNDGPSDAEDIQVTDRLPNGVRFVSASEGCQNQGGTVTCAQSNLSSQAGQNMVTFQIRVKAESPGEKTNTATVSSDTADPDGDNNRDTVTTRVLPRNAAPVARNDRYAMNENDTLDVVRAPGILINDRDPDGDQLRANLVEGPKHGRLELDKDGSFAYKPERGYSGTDSFTYKASDGTAQSNTARVNIKVREGREN